MYHPVPGSTYKALYSLEEKKLHAYLKVSGVIYDHLTCTHTHTAQYSDVPRLIQTTRRSQK